MADLTFKHLLKELCYEACRFVYAYVSIKCRGPSMNNPPSVLIGFSPGYNFGLYVKGAFARLRRARHRELRRFKLESMDRGLGCGFKDLAVWETPEFPYNHILHPHDGHLWYAQLSRNVRHAFRAVEFAAVLLYRGFAIRPEEERYRDTRNELAKDGALYCDVRNREDRWRLQMMLDSLDAPFSAVTQPYTMSLHDYRTAWPLAQVSIPLVLPPPTQHVESACFLGGWNYNNYWHFVGAILPKLVLARRDGLLRDDMTLILYSSCPVEMRVREYASNAPTAPARFIRQWLALLDFDFPQILVQPECCSIASCLYLSAVERDFAQREGVQQIRSQALARRRPTASRGAPSGRLRILLIQRKAQARTISNLSAVEGALVAFGEVRLLRAVCVCS